MTDQGDLLLDSAQDPDFDRAMTAVVRRNDPDWSADDQAELDRWRQAHPHHAHALRRAEALWDRFDMVAPAWDRVDNSGQGMSRRKALMWIGGLTVAGAGGYGLMPVGAFSDYRTAPSERRSLALSDGSEVDLGTQSALSLGRDTRHVVLDEGEAFFRISPAPQPFIVSMLGADVQTPGDTASEFALRAVQGQGLVATTFGRVSLRLPGVGLRQLEAGQEQHFSQGAMPAPVMSAPGSVAAWRQNRLIFADTALSDVVSELGRYRRVKVMTDPRVAKIRLTAVFDTADIPGAFDSLTQILPVRLVDAGVALLVVAA